jgi:dTMP kinase
MASVAEDIATLRGTKPASFKDLLTHPSFSRLWRAMLVSSLGDWVGFVAVASLVARLGGSRLGGLAVAGVMLARLLPSVLFGPFAGAFTDRFDRRKMMIAADLGRGAMYASMPFLPELWMIFGLSFLIECLSLLWTPAKDASMPNLVPRRQLHNANSIGLITTYGTLPLGAVVFTALVAGAGAIGRQVHYFEAHPEFLALWLDATTFLFSARMISGLEFPHPSRARAGQGQPVGTQTMLRDIREGFAFLKDNPLVRAMTFGIVIAFTGVGSVISLGPLFAQYTVDAGSTGFGVLMIAVGVGMGLGIGLMNVVTKVIEKDTLFWVALIASSAFLIVLAAMPNIQLAALLAIPGGAGVGLAWVSGYTLLQENVSDEFRGRTFATLTVAVRMSMFVALAGFPAFAAAIGNHSLRVGGHVFDLSGTRIALWVGGVVVVFAALGSRRGLRKSRLARPRRLQLAPRLRRAEGKGRFVVFEGVEGAGKGTQIEMARGHLTSQGYSVVVTREPGGTELGDRIRRTILDPATGAIDPRAEALLFAAARAHHVTTVIRPALAEGKIVLCDRFVDSSVAYQGVARGLGEHDVVTLNAWATQGLFPDLVLLLHLEAGEGLARAGNGGDGLDRIESEDLAFHAKVADAYLQIADEHPERFAVIDAQGTPDEVHQRVREVLDRFFADTEDGGAKRP